MTAPVAWLRKVAALYDSKRRDFNWRLAADGIIHHHNGLVYDRGVFLRRTAAGGPTAAYWAGRAAMKDGSGTESFMAPAFASRALLYRLYAYYLGK